MSKFIKIFFISYLCLVFLFEGLGIKYGREISYFLILLMPLFLFILDLINKKEIVIPKKITILFGLFILLSIISTFFAVNVQQSFEYFLYDVSIFLIFLYVYNHKELKKPLVFFILIISFIFLGYSLIINYFLSKNWDFLIPTRGYQYVYAFFKTHNPLGSMLLVSLILSFTCFIFSKKKIYILFFVLIFPFFLLSYSRSSYITLIMVIGGVFFYQLWFKKIPLQTFSSMLIGAVVTITLLFFFSTVNYQSRNPMIYNVNRLLSTNFNLDNKTFTSKRVEYFKNAVISFTEYPFFGMGPNNYLLISKKYASTPLFMSETSHNLFLDIMSENGLFALLVFLVIIALLIKNIKKNEVLYLVFVGMLILFQIDYMHRYYSFFLLFIIIAGILYEEKTTIKAQFVLLTIAALLWLIFNCLFVSKLFRKNPSILILDESYYKKANELDPFNMDIVLRRYYLEKELYGTKKAQKSVEASFIKIEKAKKLGGVYADYRKSALKVCKIIYNKCPYKI